MRNARDLFLLSALAYRQGRHKESATLYATAMASEDVDQFLSVLNEEHTVTAASLSSAISTIETTLEEKALEFANSLTAIAEDEVIVELPSQSESFDLDEETEDEALDDLETSDPSGMPGQKILPTSISTATKKVKLVISPSLHTSISLKD